MQKPGRKKILVVDDEAGIREAVCEILVMSGYDVKFAGDGKEALEILKQETMDVLITDISMPKMSGPELIKASKSVVSPQMSNIVISGFTDESIASLFLIGVDAAFSKPFKMQHLKSCIEELLKMIDSKIGASDRAFRRTLTTHCKLTDCQKIGHENEPAAMFSVLNIAAGGLCIELDALHFLPGERVKFTIEQEKTRIKSYEKIQAVVKWISAVEESENKFYCGLEFENLSPSALGHVAYLINSIRTNNSSTLHF